MVARRRVARVLNDHLSSGGGGHPSAASGARLRFDFPRRDPAQEQGATLSPDGRWMAYQSNETGRWQIYVVPFPDAAAAKVVVSTNGGTEPLWSRGGREIFYRNGAGDMVAVRVETTPTFSAGPTSMLFPAGEYVASTVPRAWPPRPDRARQRACPPTGEPPSTVSPDRTSPTPPGARERRGSRAGAQPRDPRRAAPPDSGPRARSDRSRWGTYPPACRSRRPRR